MMYRSYVFRNRKAVVCLVQVNGSPAYHRTLQVLRSYVACLLCGMLFKAFTMIAYIIKDRE